MKIWRRLGACLLCLSALAGFSGVPAQAAPPTHIFDPDLSLTGGCTVSETDPVPDPPRQLGSQAQEIAECEAGAHPDESFVRPMGMALDAFGNVYVAVEGLEGEGKGRIDVFDAEGLFITELSVPDPPRKLAVDSNGYLYATFETPVIRRYDPEPLSYNPAAGEISYKPGSTVIYAEGTNENSIAVNPENDHLFANFGTYKKNINVKVRSAVIEFGSAQEGNPLLDNEVAEVQGYGASSGLGLAIDASRGRLYATDQEPEDFPNTGRRLIRVFELAAPHNLIETLDGSSLPEGTFVKCGGTIESCGRRITIAVDESTGNLFFYDLEKKRAIFEMTEAGQYLSTIEHSLTPRSGNTVVVDNGEQSPHGQLNSEGRYLWVTDGPPGVGHAYAFKPTKVSAPVVESVTFSEVSESEALLQASINPGQAATSYRFEYTTRQQFEESGFAGAQLAGEGTIPAGTLAVPVSAQATALAPGSSYVFRVAASNEAGDDEGQADFRTYPASLPVDCPNDASRLGASEALPDCRAYELVTPPNTGGRPPLGLGGQGLVFAGLPASLDGSRVFFRIENGLIPGYDATASLAGDPYLSTRESTGWSTITTGASATEATGATSGGRSPDLTYSAWAAEGQGPAVVEGKRTNYVRFPNGISDLFGRGSLGTDPRAEPHLISENGGHLVFTSSQHLEEDAQVSGKPAVYDRIPGATTHVVSVLPGEETVEEAEAALGSPLKVSFRGASLDGRGIAFNVTPQLGAATLFLRYEGQVTHEIGVGVTFEGIAEGGARIFYLKSGSLFAFDANGGETIPFATSGNITVVNVSADGSTAYFVSPSKLTTVANPQGAKAIIGKKNLYQSREGSIRFVGTVSERDVVGEGANTPRNGLGLWVSAVHGEGGDNPGNFGIDPSRATDDGNVLLFQSDTDLTSYKSAGNRQIYRYDSGANELVCISCNPTGAPPKGDATLQNVAEDGSDPEPNGGFDLVKNLSGSGNRAFFQSVDPLVSKDTNGVQDVYEWEEQGVGSCSQPAGCLYLISSGRGEKVNYLYAASESGDDVFFRTSDLLTPDDKEAVPSIYDARVGGGFLQPPPPAECQGEGCKPQLVRPPVLSVPGSSSGKSGNVTPGCPKGKRKVKRHGKIRCVKQKKRKHHRGHQRAATTTTGAMK